MLTFKRRARSPENETITPALEAQPQALDATGAGRRGRTHAVAAWLAVLGLAATIVGGHDAIQGSDITSRALGTFVLTAGLVLIAGAIGLRGAKPLGRALAMVAALLGVALGGLMFLVQAVNDEPDAMLALWAALILLSAASAWHVRALTPADERAQGVWHQLPFLKSAVSLGVLISVGQFWYTSIYVPTTAPASLTLESKLEKVGETATRVTLKGTVTIRNTSSTKVNVLGSSLDMTAWDMTDDALTYAELEAAVALADQNAAPAERYSGPTMGSLLAHGRLVPDGFYFDPGEVLVVPLMASVPADRYERAQLDARVTIARGKVLTFEQADDGKVHEDDDGVVVLTPVPEAGWLRGLTRGNRLVRTEYASNIGGPPAIGYSEQRIVERVRKGLTRRAIYDDLDEVLTMKDFKRLIAGVKTKLGVEKLSDAPDALDRGLTKYTVFFVEDDRPKPPRACDPTCDPARFATDFDARLTRFYGVADAGTTQMLALGD